MDEADLQAFRVDHEALGQSAPERGLVHVAANGVHGRSEGDQVGERLRAHDVAGVEDRGRLAQERDARSG